MFVHVIFSAGFFQLVVAVEEIICNIQSTGQVAIFYVGKFFRRILRSNESKDMKTTYMNKSKPHENYS